MPGSEIGLPIRSSQPSAGGTGPSFTPWSISSNVSDVGIASATLPGLAGRRAFISTVGGILFAKNNAGGVYVVRFQVLVNGVQILDLTSGLQRTPNSETRDSITLPMSYITVPGAAITVRFSGPAVANIEQTVFATGYFLGA